MGGESSGTPPIPHMSGVLHSASGGALWHDPCKSSPGWHRSPGFWVECKQEKQQDRVAPALLSKSHRKIPCHIF